MGKSATACMWRLEDNLAVLVLSINPTGIKAWFYRGARKKWPATATKVGLKIAALSLFLGTFLRSKIKVVLSKFTEERKRSYKKALKNIKKHHVVTMWLGVIREGQEGRRGGGDQSFLKTKTRSWVWADQAPGSKQQLSSYSKWEFIFNNAA